MFLDLQIKSDKFEESVMMEVMRISPKIQRAVMSGKLTDKSEYIFGDIEALEKTRLAYL